MCSVKNNKMNPYLFYILLLLQYMCSEVYCFQNTAFFRSDYVAVNSTRAFYKVHPERRIWEVARAVCEAEGAFLFYPDDVDEVRAVILEMKQTLGMFSHIYIGVSTPYSKYIFETVDGKLIGDVFDKWRPSQPDDCNGTDNCVILDATNGYLDDFPCDAKLPFVCKKTMSSLRWNTKCDIPDPDYEYEELLGRCYKLHSTPRTWSDAYAVCRLEQSYLAIINRDYEAKHLKQMMEKAVRDNEVDKEYASAIHLGFKKNGIWKTTHGVPLYQSGYKTWAEGQPAGNDEICGSMSTDLNLRGVNCEQKAIFICEHEIKLLQLSIDTRYGVPDSK